MFSKSIIWPTAVVFLFFYIVPFLFFYATEACFEEYVLIDVNRPDSEFKIGLLTFGVLLMSYAFVHVFQKWSGGVFTNKNGFVFGLWVSLLLVISISLIRYATQAAFEAPFYILDGIFWISMYTIGGVVTAILSRKAS